MVIVMGRSFNISMILYFNNVQEDVNRSRKRVIITMVSILWMKYNFKYFEISVSIKVLATYIVSAGLQILEEWGIFTIPIDRTGTAKLSKRAIEKL